MNKKIKLKSIMSNGKNGDAKNLGWPEAFSPSDFQEGLKILFMIHKTKPKIASKRTIEKKSKRIEERETRRRIKVKEVFPVFCEIFHLKCIIAFSC